MSRIIIPDPQGANVVDKGSDWARIYTAATAFWQSAAFFAACRLKVFDALEATAEAGEVARRLNLSERGAQALLDACVALELLETADGAYRNTPAGQRYLTSRSPESLLVALELQAHTYPIWMSLSEAVMKGQPVVAPNDLLGGDRELTRKFVVGMHQRAVGIAGSLVNIIDLAGCRLLVDIGGGPGAYSTLMLERYPDLRARILDLPAILEVARTLVLSSGVGDRIEMVPCDVTTEAIGEGFDVALVSGLLHRMTAETCRSVLQKIYTGMARGGQVIVNDLFTVDGEPEMAVLFGLQMLLTNETGGAHDARDVASWLSAIGFVDVTITSLFPHMAIIARKAFAEATMEREKK